MKLDTIENKMRRGMQSQGGLQAVAIIGAITPCSALFGFALKGGQWWQFALAGIATIGVAFYAYDRWRSAKESRLAYADRLASLKDEIYHAISFPDKDAATEFVVALGPALQSPDRELMSWEEDVEIAATVKNGTTLYLSEAAMAAVTKVFPTPPATEQVLGGSLPWNRVAVIVGAPDKPIGLEDVNLRLKAKPEMFPHHRTFRITGGSYRLTD